MTCTEFQRALPYMMESGGNQEEEQHLRDCANCADLVADLRYIAEQAKLLVPMEEPHPRVWEGIRRSLQHEGVVSPNRPTPGPAPSWMPLHWGAWGQVGAVAALLVIVLAVALIYRGNDAGDTQAQTAPAEPGATSVASAAAPMDAEDQQLLAALEARAPSMRATYEANLRDVNTYISDARRSLEANPGNDQAWQHLMVAYEQKNMLYEMALTHSLR